ncbi:Putative chitin-binding, type 1, NodB domain, glycoside hydrolase/deacetylase, beta/alpha-barrel [Colletotrichum destructivum]|uniref:Chitin-binding, type 1, NodB domain, glycoside hydrolase/deacetylase, beta/alpha-barrel n=1 Tax=Colletotrichum destructivum TaxID=34406 RepID=A0AAX4HZ50_9PEZI|nr:Putative chitin-binding, type 1, NodB domain, glycoside hydrolase/deacetylase, beta/alpha-barrel [Colletotrichum destructivum]
MRLTPVLLAALAGLEAAHAHGDEPHMNMVLPRLRNVEELRQKRVKYEPWNPPTVAYKPRGERANRLSPRQAATIKLGDNVQCGGTFGRCADGFCCSSAGWCGQGTEYCRAPDCQISYGPGCDGNQKPSGTDTANDARPLKGSIPYGGVGIYACENDGDVAVTYDDGPYIYTAAMLDAFKAHSAVATWFITGNNLGKGQINVAYRNVIQRMFNEGHQIASHTWSHENLDQMTLAQRKNQMVYNEIAFMDILGFYPTYMRPPYSICGAECQQQMVDLGYHITYFDLDTEGYLHTDPSQIQVSLNLWDAAMIARSACNGSYLHIEHDIHQQVATTFTNHMLDSIVANGWKAVTVGECLGDPPENWYRGNVPGYNFKISAVSPLACSSTRSTSSSRTTSTRTSTSSTSTSTALAVSLDGSCGATGAKTCQGSVFGNCCSKNGWCGSTAAYCGTGCQSKYGTCGSQSSSSSVSSGRTSSSSSSSRSGTSSSSTSSSRTSASSSSIRSSTGSASSSRTSTSSSRTSASSSSIRSSTGSASSSRSSTSSSTSARSTTSSSSSTRSSSTSSSNTRSSGTASSTRSTTSSSGTGTRSATGSSSAASSTSTRPVSTNGECGSGNGRQCIGSAFGNCCSQYNFCGSTSGHCGTGCQSAFGTCNAGSSSSAGSSASSSTGSSSRSSSAAAGGSSTASSTGALPTSSLLASINGECGGLNGRTCLGTSFGNCCSQYDYCGNSAAHCGTGCKSAFGTCNAGSSSSAGSSVSSSAGTPASSAASTRVSSTNPAAATNTRLSTSGECGGTAGFNCLGSNFGDCCSPYNYCGNTTAHCDTGCQSNFGRCSGTGANVQVSLNGNCGPTNGGATCAGSAFGNCCSTYGYCGSTSAFCGTGCQSGFGTCGS